jgi:hypothetical protein
VLPDLPKLKADIADQFHLFFIKRVNACLGVVGEVPRNIIKEGRNPVILRPDSSRDETKLQTASIETIFKRDEIPHLTVQERMARMDDAAREMAGQISTHAFATINEAVDKVGNVVDGRGKPLSPEVVLEVLEKIQMDFDNDGNPKELTVVIPPALTERAKETMEKLKQDPELGRRYQEIIDKKRMEWRDRETARKLVG